MYHFYLFGDGNDTGLLLSSSVLRASSFLHSDWTVAYCRRVQPQDAVLAEGVPVGFDCGCLSFFRDNHAGQTGGDGCGRRASKKRL